MNEKIVKARNSSIRFLYKNLARPIFFLQDPEDVHDRMLWMGNTLGRSSFTRKITSLMFGYQNKMLEQNIKGMKIKNPIGLAAGFDNNAKLMDIIGEVGMGFEEVGSVTGEPCDGNKRPRLWRLKKEKSIIVNYGLANEGCERIARKFKSKRFKIPIGVSVARTNSEKTAETEAGIDDYFKAYSQFKDAGDFLVVNISCPNAYGGRKFTDPVLLEKLLSRLDSAQADKPVFVKMSPDLSDKEMDDIIRIANRHKIDGFICTNLTKKDPTLKGGISGKPLNGRANEVIRHVYSKSKGKIVIGCGGVYSAKDAYRMIRNGASMIEMITGMIYEGPQVVSEINQGLAEMLKRDGFKNISEAIGVDNQ